VRKEGRKRRGGERRGEEIFFREEAGTRGKRRER